MDTNLPDGQAARPQGANEKNESVVTVIAAILGNILVGVVKFIAAALSGSSAMIAEGIHSIVDSGNGLLILLGIRKSSKAADLEHPFGYGHELYFWTLVVAIMIFALGGGFSIYEGIHNITAITPETVLGNPTMNYIVLGCAAVIEGTSLTIGLKNFNAARGTVKPLRFIREAKDPSLFTVVLEDTAAEAGLVFAFLGVFLSHTLAMPVLDPLASVLVGLLLCSVAVILLVETKGLLIGEGLKAGELREVECIIEASPEVVECGRILTLYMGPKDMLLTADVTFREELTRDDIVSAIDKIEAQIVRAFPQTSKIFIESESFGFTYAQSIRASAFDASAPAYIDEEPDERV